MPGSEDDSGEDEDDDDDDEEDELQPSMPDRHVETPEERKARIMSEKAREIMML